MKHATPYAMFAGLAILLSSISAAPAMAETNAGWVYWTNTDNNTINRIREDGGSPEIIISALQGIESPRGIALDQDNGLMYWTTRFAPAKVQRATMDGGDIVTLVDTTSSGGVGGFSDIVLDVAGGKMY